MSHRTQITLTDEQYARLLDESRRSGLGLAELVRRALDRTYVCQDGDALLGALQASFGTWAERDEDGAAYVERIRRGMADRLGGP